MTGDFYKILGVSDSASQAEIKKAYRSLSLKFHPDKTQGDPEGTSKFQKISEAYETLGDEEKRHEYDAMQKNPFMRMNSMGGHGTHPSAAAHFHEMDELFQSIFGGGGIPGAAFMGMGMGNGLGGGGFGGPGGPGIHVFRNGVPVNPINMMHQMQKPPPIIQNVEISMEQVLNGANVPIEIERWIVEGGNKVFEKETVYVPIPKGVDDNEIIMLREKGNVMNERSKGDIKLFIKINNTTDFKRNGLDLVIERKISLKEALCGFTFVLKHINGKSYTINNSQGSIVTPDYFKSIPNMGLTRDGHTGNLVIAFDVSFPDSLTPDQMKKLREVL
jgi:DnaJ-class molecular chaperone